MMTIPGTIERLTAPLHDELKILRDDWRAKKGSAKAPSRALILPEELAPLLPYLALFDVLDRGDFHVRLWGTGLVRTYDGDLTGKLVSECDLDAISAQLREQLADVVRECRPNYPRQVREGHRRPISRIGAHRAAAISGRRDGQHDPLRVLRRTGILAGLPRSDQNPQHSGESPAR
jgi:PAS domain